MVFRIVILLIFISETLQYCDDDGYEYNNFLQEPEEYSADLGGIKPNNVEFEAATPLHYNDIDEVFRKIMAGRTFFTISTMSIDDTKQYQNFRNQTIYENTYHRTRNDSRNIFQNTILNHTNKRIGIESNKKLQSSNKRNKQTSNLANKKTKVRKQRSKIIRSSLVSTKYVDQMKLKRRNLRSQDKKKSRNKKNTREEHPVRSTYTVSTPLRTSLHEFKISKSNPNHGKPSRSSKKPTKGRKNGSWKMQKERWTPQNKSKNPPNKGRSQPNSVFIRPSRSTKRLDHKTSEVFLMNRRNRLSSVVIGATQKKLQSNISLIPTPTKKKITPARSMFKFSNFYDHNLFDTTVTDVFPKPENLEYSGDIITRTATILILYPPTRLFKKGKPKASLGVTRTKPLRYLNKSSYQDGRTKLLRYPERLPYFDGKSPVRTIRKKSSPVRSSIQSLIHMPGRSQVKTVYVPIRSTLRNVTHTSIIAYAPVRSSILTHKPKRTRHTQSFRKGLKKQSTKKTQRTEAELYEPHEAMAKLKAIIQGNRAKIANALKIDNIGYVTTKINDDTDTESYYDGKPHNIIKQSKNVYPMSILERVTPLFQALKIGNQEIEGDVPTKSLDTEETEVTDIYLMWGGKIKLTTTRLNKNTETEIPTNTETTVLTENTQEKIETDKQGQRETNKQTERTAKTNLLRVVEETTDAETMSTDTQPDTKTGSFVGGYETLSTINTQSIGITQQSDSTTEMKNYDWNKTGITLTITADDNITYHELEEGDVDTNKQTDTRQLPATSEDNADTTISLMPYLETQSEIIEETATETMETNNNLQHHFIYKKISASKVPTISTIDKMGRQLDPTPNNQISPLDNQVSSPDDQISSPDDQISSPDNQISSLDNQISFPDNKISSSDNQVSNDDNQLSTLDDQLSPPFDQNSDSLPFYPYSSTLHPPDKSEATEPSTTLAKKKETKTKGPLFDVDMFLEILANLTYDYDTNLTMVMNMTLKERGAPTCGTPRGWYAWMGWPNFTWPTPSTTTTTEPYVEVSKSLNNTVMAKCFVCGLKEHGIPYSTDCADAFAGDFLPLVPINPIAKARASSYRKYCRYGEVYNYHENATRPKSIYGRWTGGCSVRWTDLTGLYTQRACRNRRRPTTGEHYASKRMAKLEFALSAVEDGCIITPAATLLPISRGVSLYSRFHACVCSGSWCNMAATLLPHVAATAVTAVAIAGIWSTLVKAA